MGLPDNSSKNPRDGRTSRRLPAWLDQLISGKAPSDPLYLSNRSTFRRLRPYIFLVLFFLVLLVVWQVAMPRVEPPAAVRPWNGKVADIPSPRFETTQLEVVNAGVVDNGARVEGTVKNKTGHIIAIGRLTFELEDDHGGFTGAVSTDLKQIPPGEVTRFEFPIRQPESRRVLVTGISVE